jgi:hypothetical protein
MPSKTIQTTKNYRMFRVSEDNRPLDLSKRKTLRDSMKMYGFLKSFPISCVRGDGKYLIVKDGQNRLAIAEELGLPVHYVIEEVDYDIATVNNAQQKWSMKDYAMKWASQNRKPYCELLEFIEQHSIPISLGLSLLSGSLHYSGEVRRQFKSGKFKITDYEFADKVASVYVQLTSLSPVVRNRNFLSAVTAVMRVESFECKRLIDGAKKRPEKLKAYSTREGYLDMIEDIYNFNRSKLVPIKLPALQALREKVSVANK